MASSVNVFAMTRADPYLARIEAFSLRKGGGLTVTKVQNGYNLYHTATDAPIARLNPTGSNDDMRIRFWSYRKRRQDVGDLGEIILPLEQALEEIATNEVFWTWAWAWAFFLYNDEFRIELDITSTYSGIVTLSERPSSIYTTRSDLKLKKKAVS